MGQTWDARQCGLVGDGATNDQPALAELVDRLGAGYAADGIPRVIHCPPGVYAIRDAGTVWRSGVSLVGSGIGVTRFVLSNPGDRSQPVPLAYFTTVQHGASRENHIADCTFAGFEIDGSGVVMDDYNYLAKGLGLQYVRRGRFRDLWIHDTGATGLGCDFLQDTVIDAVVAERCGRLDNGRQMGGAGIGIGIGGWGPSERLTATACSTLGNGTNGIFVELQKDYWPPPRGIRIIGCHAEGNRYGISDWGADGLIVSACTMLGNRVAGYDVSTHGTAGVAGRGGIVTDCVMDGNVSSGVSFGGGTGPYLIRGNRISGNGRYGFRLHDIGSPQQPPIREIVLDGNDIWGNGLSGIQLDAASTDLTLVGNRIRSNGRRAGPAAAGQGPDVRYGQLSMTDSSADWAPDAHFGKELVVDGRTAMVMSNDRNRLTLTPIRAGLPTAWTGEAWPEPDPDGGPPPDGAGYRLLGPPPHRAGVTVAGRTTGLTMRNNRVWDGLEPKTQTEGIWVTGQGLCRNAAVEDNDLAGNRDVAILLDTPAEGGRWARNHGCDDG
ncbi:right-handed parallel beta-helix repeat-containing protein [Plantactinospora siamensis]|uniref:Right-handed parallel beta-helix repeat-containing protein n=1 Tax=Plantactinospora siamensis TaxID=555372 RepID=A0ABV6P047_9ACTN